MYPNKAIVSYANHKHVELLSIAAKTFEFYGNKFNYDVHICDEDKLNNIADRVGMQDYKNRPPSWSKIPILIYYLQYYDIVLWLDADTIITEFINDISHAFAKHTEYIQAFTSHIISHNNTMVPNLGVWILRTSAVPMLYLAWQKLQYINHAWWEQMAIIDLMNWNIYENNQYQLLSKYGKQSLELPYSFNTHKDDIRFNNTEPEIFHATMFNNRLEIMQNKLNIANNNMHDNTHSIYNSNFRFIQSRDMLLNHLLDHNMKMCLIGCDIEGFLYSVLQNKINIDLTIIDNFDTNKFSASTDGCNNIFYTSQQYKSLIQQNFPCYKDSVDILLNNNNLFNLIYIDGDHGYKECLRDLEFAFQYIKPNGYICGHDYNTICSKTCKATAYANTGVFTAVKHFCIKYKQQILYETLDGLTTFCIKVNK